MVLKGFAKLWFLKGLLQEVRVIECLVLEDQDNDAKNVNVFRLIFATDISEHKVYLVK